MEPVEEAKKSFYEETGFWAIPGASKLHLILFLIEPRHAFIGMFIALASIVNVI